MEKRGAVNWTIGKLLNIVLLVVVLVLIVYGMTTGGLNPLIDNLGAKFDEVQIFMGFEEDFYEGCYSSKISDIDKGDDFLKSLGVSENDAFLEICRDGACTVNGSGIGKYRLLKGNIDKFENGGWVRYFYYDRIFAGRDYWEKYNAGVDLLESLGLGDIYDGALSRRFVLFGDGLGFNNNVTAVWQNGKWVVQENREKVEYFEEDDGINAFVNIVNDGLNDNVFFGYDSLKNMNKVFLAQGGVGNFIKPGGDDCSVYCNYGGFYRTEGVDSNAKCSHGTLKNNGFCCCTGKDFGFDVFGDVVEWKEIGDLIGDSGWLGYYNKIDNDNEVDKLNTEFAKIEANLLKEAEVSSDEILKMKSLVGKKVLVDGKEFVVSLDESGYFPVVVFDSGKDKFGLELGAFSKVESELFGDVALRYFPVYLVEWSGSEWKRVGDEEVYRLTKDKFDEVVFGDLISKFLRSKCK